MKKSILATIFLMSALWCDAQSIAIPSNTVTTTFPSGTITRTMVSYSESWTGTDVNGNPVQWTGNWNGPQADSARLSPSWRLISLNAQNNGPFTLAQIQAWIANHPTLK